METTRLKVAGMTCGSCVAAVTRALKGVSGVTNVEVNLTSGTARVSTRDGTGVLLSEMIAVLAATGYEAGQELPALDSLTVENSAEADATSVTRRSCCCK